MKTDKRYAPVLSAMLTDPAMREALEAVASAQQLYFTQKAIAAVRERRREAAEEAVHYADAWKHFVPALLEEAGLSK